MPVRCQRGPVLLVEPDEDTAFGDSPDWSAHALTVAMRYAMGLAEERSRFQKSGRISWK
nr:MAG TPA: hypothetical protein [Caudoviricetes sp.]